MHKNYNTGIPGNEKIADDLGITGVTHYKVLLERGSTVYVLNVYLYDRYVHV